MKQFCISATSDKFWNRDDFVMFLAKNSKDAMQLTVDPEAICLGSLGVYDLLGMFGAQDVEIITGNPLEHHERYHVKVKKNGWFYQQPKINVNQHQWNGRKTFYALYSRPTAARLALASKLFYDYAEQSHVHFSAWTCADNLSQFELDKLLHYDVASTSRAGNLLQHLPLLLSDPGRYTATQGYDYQDPLTDLYQDILVDVVVESHVLGETFYPTEKTLRSMWLKKPFLMFASRDYLAYLRQMGFQTFFEFWSEDYDGYETRERLLRILDTIDYIARLSSRDRHKIYQVMQPVLEHNYTLLTQRKFSTEITKIV